MPTYEYRCPRGHDFELFQRMSDEPRTPCPQCGEEAARLLSSGAGFLFRGDGFYITDYRSDDYRKAAKSETGDKGSATDAGAGAGGDKAGSSAGGDKVGSDSAAAGSGGGAPEKSAASKESGSASPAAASKPSPALPGGASGSS